MGDRLETTGMRSDGIESPAEFAVTNIAIAGQSRFTVYVRDITARKRAEEAVVWLAAIVESSQDAIYGGDLEGRTYELERYYCYKKTNGQWKATARQSQRRLPCD
jgi:PAS domain-containing protein